MLRLPLFLLATSAAAIPSSYLRPLERDLRDMETVIKALNAKAARKGLRLEKTSKGVKTVQVVHPDDESVFFYVKLGDDCTVGALKAKIVTIMKKSNAWFYCKGAAGNYNKNKLLIGDANKATALYDKFSDNQKDEDGKPTDKLNDEQKVYLIENCMVNEGATRTEKIPMRKWTPLKGKTF